MTDQPDLGTAAFWRRSLDERMADFAVLREQGPFTLARSENPLTGVPDEFYAVTRYAEVVEISRHPADYCSGKGSISIADMPTEAMEFFGSFITMDDPRHARQRGIVARSFTPRALQGVLDSVETICTEVIDDMCEQGEVDLVEALSQPFPLLVICDMMGIPRSEFGTVLDATNVISSPRCTAITGVALDHQDKLGETLDAIAREKAAIAKPGVPMVLGPMPDEARRAAVEVATANGARIVEAGALPPDVRVGLAGAHQRENARVAWTIGAELGLRPDERARGLSDARWPGRLERIDVADGELAGPWILDGAHNPDGARALVRALEGEEVGAVVFGALADKAWREMLGAIAMIRAPRIYVAPGGRAPADPGALATEASGTAASSVGEALASARRVADDRAVVVCGSLYLVGEARGRLLRIPSDPIVAL